MTIKPFPSLGTQLRARAAKRKRELYTATTTQPKGPTMTLHATLSKAGTTLRELQARFPEHAHLLPGLVRMMSVDEVRMCLLTGVSPHDFLAEKGRIAKRDSAA